MKMTFQEIRIIATVPCITNQLRDVNTICRRSWYIAAHIWKIYDLKIEVVPFIINFSTDLTTIVKFEVQVQKWCGRSGICGLFLTSSSGGYINGRNSANLELLIDKTSSIYLYVKLKALASWIFLSFTSFWRNSDSYEYKNKSARRGAQFVPIGMSTTCWNSIPPKETNMLSMRNSSILITCSSE